MTRESQSARHEQSSSNRRLKLGVLDQVPVYASGGPRQAILDSCRLAVAVEKLGYSRYWVAEHHSTVASACASPEILCAQLCAITSEIRVGAGGVLLNHYSPLKVAETFRVLEALYPSRIDLGFGRSLGGSPRVADALAPGGAADLHGHLFNEKLRSLRGFLSGSFSAGHPLKSIHAVPKISHAPPFWYLGAGARSADFAATENLNYAYGHFIVPDGQEAVQLFRTRVADVPAERRPDCLVAVFVICAESEAQLVRASAGWKRWLLSSLRGDFMPIPPFRDGEVMSDADISLLAPKLDATVIGTAPDCAARLRELASSYGVDELLVVTACSTYEDRLRSYELLAGAILEGA